MFSNAKDALAHIRDRGTDILITNHGMGKMTGTDLIRGGGRQCVRREKRGHEAS